MSYRSEILASLIYRMKQITVANGYQTDIGEKAREWSPAVKEKAQLPLLQVHDARCATNIDRAGAHTKRLSIEIGVIAQAGAQVSETGLMTDEGAELEARTDNLQRDLRIYMEDILKALGEVENDLRGSMPIQEVILVEDEISVFDENEKLGECVVRIEIEYPCKRWEQ